MKNVELGRVFIKQFETAVWVQKIISTWHCDQIELVVKRNGNLCPVMQDKETLLKMAGELASRRWSDLKALGLEDVANDILYQSELKFK